LNLPLIELATCWWTAFQSPDGAARLDGNLTDLTAKGECGNPRAQLDLDPIHATGDGEATNDRDAWKCFS
jgi:hypothetical protein